MLFGRNRHSRVSAARFGRDKSRIFAIDREMGAKARCGRWVSIRSKRMRVWVALPGRCRDNSHTITHSAACQWQMVLFGK